MSRAPGDTSAAGSDDIGSPPPWTDRFVDPPTWVIGLIGLGFAVAVSLRTLIPADMDPTIFLALGRDKPIQTTYAGDLIGDVSIRPGGGHDGKFFFAQANDPFYLEPEVHAAVLDDPIYRGQRMLYPSIAGGFGLFPPGVVVWVMLVTNVLALAIGTILAARIAISLGGSSWLGLSVPLNVGLIYELEIDGAGVVAYVCCLAALVALARDEPWLAAAWLAAGALGREVMLAFAFGLFLLIWRSERRWEWRLLVVPVGVLAAWSVYLRIRLSGIPGTGGAPANFAPPLQGFFEALEAWISEPRDLLLNVAIVVAVLAFTVLALRSRSPIAWGALPFVALSLVLSVNVWREPFDFSRILAPVLTAAPFLLFAPSRGTVVPSDPKTIQETM
jgi:hypothetical protein